MNNTNNENMSIETDNTLETEIKPLNIIELFGGIGAFSAALKRLGVPYNVVDYVEIDKYACKSYNAINGTNFEPQDISHWDKDIDVSIDIIMHGSPCQDFSIAGNGKGGDKDSGTRSSLMYETLRIVDKIKPRVVIWENVKNLLSAKHRHNFDAYLQRMSDMGYTNYYKVLDAKDYNVPQHRERIFTVSILGEHEEFVFPEKRGLEITFRDILESEVDKKYYLAEKYESITHINENYLMMNGGTIGRMHDIARRAYNENGVAPTVHTVGDGNMEAKVYKKDENNNIIIRKLTPREYWRLQSFSDEAFDKAAEVNSKTQLYKQAGNSICVEVLCRIIECLGYAEKSENFQ